MPLLGSRKRSSLTSNTPENNNCYQKLLNNLSGRSRYHSIPPNLDGLPGPEGSGAGELFFQTGSSQIISPKGISLRLSLLFGPFSVQTSRHVLVGFNPIQVQSLGHSIARLPFQASQRSVFTLPILDEVSTSVIPCFFVTPDQAQIKFFAIPSNDDLFYTSDVVICKVGWPFFDQPEKSLAFARSFESAFLEVLNKKSQDAARLAPPDLGLRQVKSLSGQIFSSQQACRDERCKHILDL